MAEAIPAKPQHGVHLEQPHAPRKPKPLVTSDITMQALKQSFVMLRPDIQWKNPVMFVVEIGAILTLLFMIQSALGASASQVPTGYFVALDVWLFLTVLFANFATALAEARGKAQAASLRSTRADTEAHRMREDGTIDVVSSTVLKKAMIASSLRPGRNHTG